MTASARRSLVAALVAGLLALGLVVVPNAAAADGDVSVNSPAPVSEPAGTRTVTFTITLVRPPSGNIRVNYTTQDGTATAFEDYLPVNDSVIFTGNQTTATASVALLDDSLDEDDETFDLVLSESENGVQIVNGTGTATITDNDEPPRVSIGGAVVDEGDTGTTQARFTVALSSSSGRAVSVMWATGDATATGGVDFTASSDQTLSFDPGDVSEVVSVPVNGDVLDEDEETFTVTLSQPTNATLGPVPRGTGSIVDDDDLPTLSISDASGSEGGQADFTVSLSPASGRVVTVSATTVGGTATPGPDYTGTSGDVRFDPGQTSKTFTVPLKTDMLDEPDETFQVTLSGAQSALIGRATGTGTIVDTNPGPELSITVNEVDGHVEGDLPAGTTMNFTVVLSGTPGQLVTVNYEAVDGTAKAGQDYTVAPGTLTFLPNVPNQQRAIPVTVTGDDFAELNETFTVRLTNPSAGANLASGQGEATGTIIDDDGVPAKVAVADAAAVVEGAQGATAVFTVALSLAVPQPVIVTYSTKDGTAKAGEDYVGSTGTVTFAPNDTSEEIRIPVLPDSLDEDDTETFTVELSNPINADITGAGSDPTATGSITDDDALPTVSIENDVDLEEGNETPSTGNVVVKLSTASGRQVTVNFTTGAEAPDNLATANATVDVDYRALANGTLTFPAGETTRRISIEALPDDLDEDPEVLVATLSAPTNANPGTKTTGVVTIEDGDLEPEVSITGPDPVIEPEPNGSQVDAIFAVSLSRPSGRTVTVQYATADGSAEAAQNDYTDQTDVLASIDPGESGTAIMIAVNEDGDVEGNEDFTVTISSPTGPNDPPANAAFPDDPERTTATAVILDTDSPPQLSVFGSTVPEGNAGTTAAQVTVRLVPPAGTPVTVRLTTADDSAVAPEDYAALNEVITFAPGETAQTRNVSVVGELLDEPTEVITLDLSEPAGATVAQGSSTISVVDDDGPSVSVADVTVTEGNGASTEATFVVSLSAPSPQAVSVDYATSAGTATAADDFTSVQAQSLVFDSGETIKSVAVDVIGDNLDEADETFSLGLSNAVNATIGRSLGTATILDDDQPALLVAAAVGSADNPSVLESDFGAATLVFTLSLQSPAGFQATRESSVGYATTSTRAVAGGDFLPLSGRVTFAPGETVKTVVVGVIGDSLDEPDETVNLALTDPVNLSLPAEVTGTILDDDKPGYALVAADGGIFAFGAADFVGSTGSMKLNQPIVGMAAHPSGRGYWLVATDGGVFAFGEAAFHGSTGGMRLNRPLVGMAATPSGKGYWLVATDGGIFAFGDAVFQGSTGAMRLNKPVAGMASTPSGKGYWLVATDGGIFAFGDARFQGSTGSMVLNQPIVGMASTTGGQGYWLVATDGGIFAFGDAAFHGSTGAMKLNQPVVGMAPSPSGKGYWLVASDGGIFTFGDAEFLGSTGNIKLNRPVVGMAVL